MQRKQAAAAAADSVDLTIGIACSPAKIQHDLQQQRKIWMLLQLLAHAGRQQGNQLQHFGGVGWAAGSGGGGRGFARDCRCRCHIFPLALL